MSLSTWLAEHLPMSASSVRNYVDALRHSLRKWTGLRRTVLEKHGLEARKASIVDLQTCRLLPINSDNCALCHVTFIVDVEGSDCVNCPLYQHLGRRCDCNKEGESPFAAWVRRQDPEPMIRALKKSLEVIENKNTEPTEVVCHAEETKTT